MLEKCILHLLAKSCRQCCRLTILLMCLYVSVFMYSTESGCVLMTSSDDEGNKPHGRYEKSIWLKRTGSIMISRWTCGMTSSNHGDRCNHAFRPTWQFYFTIWVVRNPYFASLSGLKVNPWEYIHSGPVALPAVLPKVHHRPETLYVPTEVNTLQVDGLARIPGLTQALYKSHPQPPNSVPRPPTSDPPKR